MGLINIIPFDLMDIIFRIFNSIIIKAIGVSLVFVLYNIIKFIIKKGEDMVNNKG